MHTPTFENSSILAVTSHADVRHCVVAKKSFSEALTMIRETLAKQNLPSPQILDVSLENGSVVLLLTAPGEVLEAQTTALNLSTAIKIDTAKRSTVTVTCQGSYASILIDSLVQKLETKKIEPLKILPGALSVTFLVREDQRQTAIQTLHG